MKVTYKIFFLISIVTITSLFFYGVYSFKRDLNHFVTDMKNDAKTLSKVLSVEIINLWNKEGQPAVSRFIQIAKSSSDIMRFRWVWLKDNSSKEYEPHIKTTTILEDMEKNNTDFVTYRIGNTFFSYMMINIPGNRPGALEISEDLTLLIKTFSKNNILHLGATGFLILLAGIITVWLMGHFILTKRINKILTYIKEIGAGNLSTPFVIKGKDELSIISEGLERMRINLKKTRNRLIKSKNDKINLLQQLHHSDRLALIGKISSGIAHEIGTPLNIITGRAKLITNEDLTKSEIIENSRIIYEQSNRISEIIRDFLKFARRKKIKKEFMTINHPIHKVIELINPEAKKQNIELMFHEDKMDTKLFLDEIQIQQVLSNVILNAIQAINENGKIEIAIEYKELHHPDLENSELTKYAVISIRDNGTGIPEENIKHIFEPYFSTKDPGKGTGLGLSLSSDIIKEHQGWISVSNNEDKGCCFRIFLPCNGGK